MKPQLDGSLLLRRLPQRYRLVAASVCHKMQNSTANRHFEHFLGGKWRTRHLRRRDRPDAPIQQLLSSLTLPIGALARPGAVAIYKKSTAALRHARSELSPNFQGDPLADPDLSFQVRQNERILTEIASLRDDMAVLTALVMRLDRSHAALLQKMRATHSQIARMNDRHTQARSGQ